MKHRAPFPPMDGRPLQTQRTNGQSDKSSWQCLYVRWSLTLTDRICRWLEWSRVHTWKSVVVASSLSDAEPDATHRRNCDTQTVMRQLQPNVVQTVQQVANNMSRMNFSENVGHVTISSWMFTIACCLVVGLGLGLDCLVGKLLCTRICATLGCLSHCPPKHSTPHHGRQNRGRRVSGCSPSPPQLWGAGKVLPRIKL